MDTVIINDKRAVNCGALTLKNTTTIKLPIKSTEKKSYTRKYDNVTPRVCLSTVLIEFLPISYIIPFN